MVIKNNTLTFIASIDGELYEFLGVTKALYFTISETQNLLTQEKRSGGLADLLKELSLHSIESLNNKKNKTSRVFHLFYELGVAIDSRIDVVLDKDCSIGMYLEFSDKRLYELPKQISSFEAALVKGPSYESYQKAFKKGLEHLKRGDCYQYNLTYPFSIQFPQSSFEELLSCVWRHQENRGEFASFTQLPNIRESYFSNSPECLFRVTKQDEEFSIETLPIKGTRSTESLTQEEAWLDLKRSEKDQSELFMITDLMRNDLSRLSEKWVSVISKKAKMIVPGLVHSYSHLKGSLSKEKTLYDIVQCLFPGGSITGAPKVRVMEILDSLEEGPRGFYCGSTIIATDNTLQGSINIRSSVVDFQLRDMRYHSGGGVTFKSSAELEFNEMWDKVQSFTGLLDPRQYKKSIKSES